MNSFNELCFYYTFLKAYFISFFPFFSPFVTLVKLLQTSISECTIHCKIIVAFFVVFDVDVLIFPTDVLIVTGVAVIFHSFSIAYFMFVVVVVIVAVVVVVVIF